MIKCPNCDKAIFDTAVRCRHCKTKLLDGNVIAPLTKLRRIKPMPIKEVILEVLLN
jgi:hypothetical protein